MIRCNTTIITLCGAFLITSLIPQIMEAQHFSRIGIEEKTDSLDREIGPNKGIILKPVVDEYLYYDPYQDIYTLQNGLFLGPSHAGIETTIRHSGRGVFTAYEPDFYLGVFTSAILGAELRVSDRTSLFMHGGGRVYWFPELDEIGFMGVPVISVGIQFTTSPELPMVRY
jgi:hypothetical protein